MKSKLKTKQRVVHTYRLMYTYIIHKNTDHHLFPLSIISDCHSPNSFLPVLVPAT